MIAQEEINNMLKAIDEPNADINKKAEKATKEFARLLDEGFYDEDTIDSLTSDLSPQELKWEHTEKAEWIDKNSYSTDEEAKGIKWNISPSANVDPILDNAIGAEYAQGYTKGKQSDDEDTGYDDGYKDGKADMQERIDAAIAEIKELNTYYHAPDALDKALGILDKHLGE